MQVRVRIEAIGSFRAEAGFRSGGYIERAILPARIGYEASGVVEALGEGVKNFSVGEPICIIAVVFDEQIRRLRGARDRASFRCSKTPDGTGNAHLRCDLDAVPDSIRSAPRHFQDW